MVWSICWNIVDCAGVALSIFLRPKQTRNGYIYIYIYQEVFIMHGTNKENCLAYFGQPRLDNQYLLYGSTLNSMAILMSMVRTQE
jgi:hypothetical protein